MRWVSTSLRQPHKEADSKKRWQRQSSCWAQQFEKYICSFQCLNEYNNNQPTRLGCRDQPLAILACHAVLVPCCVHLRPYIVPASQKFWGKWAILWLESFSSQRACSIVVSPWAPGVVGMEVRDREGICSQKGQVCQWREVFLHGRLLLYICIYSPNTSHLIKVLQQQ